MGMGKSPLWVHADEDCAEEAAMLTVNGVMDCTLTRSRRSLHMLNFPPESTNSPLSSSSLSTRAVAEIQVPILVLV